MFVGGLPPEMTSSELEEYFAQYGYIDHVRVVGEVRGKQRGYGFVTFSHKETLNQVLRIKDHRIKGRLIDCNYATDPKEEENGYGDDENDFNKKVFISDLPISAYKEDIKNHCSQFGPVKKVLFFIRQNKEMAFAFVIFENEKDRDASIKAGLKPFLGNKETKIRCVAVAIPLPRHKARALAKANKMNKLESAVENSCNQDGFSYYHKNNLQKYDHHDVQ